MARQLTPQSHPFDHRLSLRLDRLIVALERTPPAVERWALRLQKRAAERGVPAFKGARR